MIERAQRAVVIGPIDQNALRELVVSVGTMARAQVEMARCFMQEKLGMPQEEVSRCGLMQVCSTNDDCLLIKFPTIQQCRLLNSFKKNLPRESKVEDFIPPCLMELERVLISHGDRIRAANSTAAFKVRTRRVWLKGTRVLQGKMSQFHGYQNLLGLEGLGR